MFATYPIEKMKRDSQAALAFRKSWKWGMVRYHLSGILSTLFPIRLISVAAMMALAIPHSIYA